MKIIEINCDECRRHGDMSAGPDGPAVHVMRTRLKVLGWWTGLKGGKDYCSTKCRDKAVADANKQGEQKEIPS
jgi:hypothetical protein